MKNTVIELRLRLRLIKTTAGAHGDKGIISNTSLSLHDATLGGTTTSDWDDELSQELLLNMEETNTDGEYRWQKDGIYDWIPQEDYEGPSLSSTATPSAG